jgi:hypothetical protein
MNALHEPAARRSVHLGIGAGLVVALCAMVSPPVEAHGVSSKDALFLLSLNGPAIIPLMYLGAKHMVTGYDHLLFLFGVIFFLYRPRDVIAYVSLFTVGHSITLLAGVLGGVSVNAYAIDTIIGLSVAYKAFENIGGFERVFGIRPHTRLAVLVFGLFHGLGLATRLQEFALSPQGLVTNILSFNAGVELGQICALTAALLGLAWWRTRPAFYHYAFATNVAIMTGGFVLAGYQAVGYLLSRSAAA